MYAIRSYYACIDACPGRAFPDGQWDVARCVDFLGRSTQCHRTCHARLAPLVDALLGTQGFPGEYARLRGFPERRGDQMHA